MGKAKLISGRVVLSLAGGAGWPIVSWEIANLDVQTDMPHIAAQVAPRIGLKVCSRSRHRLNGCRRASQKLHILVAAMCPGIRPQAPLSDFENYRKDQGAFGGLFVDVAF